MKYFFIVIFSAILAFPAYAKDGFSGFFDIGLLTVQSTDALFVTDDNEKIDNISENAESYNANSLIAFFNVRYRSEDIEYHMGTSLDAGAPEPAIGVTKYFGSSSFDVSLVVNPFNEAWEDPFIADRDSTKATYAGIKLKYDQVGGTPHSAELKIYKHNIDDDKIGERFSSIERDGYSADLSVGYDFFVSIGKFTPIIGLTADIRDGDAESSKGAYIKFLNRKRLDTGFLLASVSIAYKDYNEKNPVFDKKREEIESAAFLMYQWKDPFGLKNKHITLLAGAANRMSGIDFYDANTIFGGASFGFDF